MAVLSSDRVIVRDAPNTTVISGVTSLSIQAFNEKQDFVLTQDVAYNDPNNWVAQLGSLPAGTVIDSHYVWLKPGTSTYTNATATVTFDNPIIALIGGDRELLASNALLGVNGIIYPGGDQFGVRQMDNDNFNGTRDTAIANGNVLTLNVTARDGIDPVRVITAAFPSSTPVPAPVPAPVPVPVPDGTVEFAVALTFPRAGATNPRTIRGSGRNDTLRGNGGQNLLIGQAGNDLIRGKNGKDTIRAGAGNDRAFGDGGNELIQGGSGNDRLIGGTGADVLAGNQGRDTLIGGAGTDMLTGGADNDLLIGGAGKDVFTFRSINDGVDTIRDFAIGTDLIDLRGIFTTTPTAAQFGQFIQLTQVGANTRLSVNSDGTGSDSVTLATLLNQTAANFNAASFVVV